MKLLNLARSLVFVKALLLLPIALFAQNNQTDIILARGEQKELSFTQLKRLSIGNSDVLSHKMIKNKLLIKGKKIGFSDLIVWDDKAIKFNIYVLSKQKYLKTIQLADALRNLNLHIDIKGPMITAQGEIADFGDYLYLQKIKKQFKDQVFFKVKLSTELRNFIIAHVYRRLYQNNFSKVSCTNEWLDILCSYEGNHNPKIITQLQNSHAVFLMEQDSNLKQKNYQLKMKIVQVESLDGKEVRLGLDKLSSKVSDLFDFGIRKLIDDNYILLSQSKINLSTLAEPEMVVNLDHPQLIEIGSQIPYQNISTQNANIIAPIDWRFAGLKISTHISANYGKLLVKYTTEFSRPMDNGISGSKEVSSVILVPGEAIKIFQIGFKTSSRAKDQIPFLSEVPILKHLFTSRSSSESYKQIYGYIQLEEIE